MNIQELLVMAALRMPAQTIHLQPKASTPSFQVKRTDLQKAHSGKSVLETQNQLSVFKGLLWSRAPDLLGPREAMLWPREILQPKILRSNSAQRAELGQSRRTCTPRDGHLHSLSHTVLTMEVITGRYHYRCPRNKSVGLLVRQHRSTV